MSIDFRAKGRELGETMGEALVESMASYGDAIPKEFNDRAWQGIEACLKDAIDRLRIAGASDDQLRPYLEEALAAIKVKMKFAIMAADAEGRAN